eukprot:3664637-Amphidinium_carterae.1
MPLPAFICHAPLPFPISFQKARQGSSLLGGMLAQRDLNIAYTGASKRHDSHAIKTCGILGVAAKLVWNTFSA